MALRYEGPVSRVTLGGLAPEGASDLYAPMEARYLEVYEVSNGDEIQATVETIAESRHAESNDEVEGLEGILISWNQNTRLFLQADFFTELRDWGFVEEGFWISLEMNRARTDEGDVDLYPRTEKVYDG